MDSSHYKLHFDVSKKSEVYQKARKSMHLKTVRNLVIYGKNSLAKGPVTRCNFPGNLQRNSNLKRCKLVTNV